MIILCVKIWVITLFTITLKYIIILNLAILFWPLRLVYTSDFWDAESWSDAIICIKSPRKFAKVFQCKSLATVKYLSNLCVYTCHWIEIHYCNRHLWKTYNWKIQLSFSFSLSDATKNRKMSIPKFCYAIFWLSVAIFDPKIASLRDFASKKLLVYTIL